MFCRIFYLYETPAKPVILYFIQRNEESNLLFYRNPCKTLTETNYNPAARWASYLTKTPLVLIHCILTTFYSPYRAVGGLGKAHPTAFLLQKLGFAGVSYKAFSLQPE